MIVLPIIIPSLTSYRTQHNSESFSLVDRLKRGKRFLMFFYAFCFGLLLCLLLALETLFDFVSSSELPVLVTLICWCLSLVPLVVGECGYYESALDVLCLYKASSCMLSLDRKKRRRCYGVLLTIHWICIAEGIILFFLMRPEKTSLLWDENYFVLSMLHLIIGVFVGMGLVLFSCSAFEVHRERRRWRKLRDIDPNFQMTFAEYAHAVEPETEKALTEQKSYRHHRGQNP